MATMTLPDAPARQASATRPSHPKLDACMYAIAFDMDTDTLQRVYTGPYWHNATPRSSGCLPCTASFGNKAACITAGHK